MKKTKILCIVSTVFAAVIAGVMSGIIPLTAATVGQTVSNVKIQSAEGNPSVIPHLGGKIVSIFYNDPDTADIADPLADAIKAKNYPADKYVGIGVANCKDAPFKPDGVIRWVLRRKSREFKSIMMADVDHSVVKAWDLGDCDDTCAVIIIGKDMKVKWVGKIKNQAQSKTYIEAVTSLLDKLVAQ